MATATVTTAVASAGGGAVASATVARTFNTAGTIVMDVEDFSKLVIRLANISSTASIAFTLESNSDYSSQGIGDGTVTVATAGEGAISGVSAKTVVVGGLESARYKSSSGTLIITVPTAATGYVEAYELESWI
jgi:hypothetical protein